MSHWDNRRLEMLPYVPTRAQSVLDVGCSTGAFAAALRQERPEVAVDGVEPDAAAAARARTHMRYVFEGNFPGADLRGGSYDCVVFLDSLEHMIDPWAALRAAREHLTVGGAVVASLPNVRHIHALRTILRERDWPWHDQNIFDRTHLRWFTQKSMVRLFVESGYVVAAIEPINVWRNGKTRALSLLLGKDIAATQYAIVARPA